MRTSAKVASAFLLTVALLHLLRLLFHVKLVVGAFDVPMWASVLGILGPGGLALWLCREHRQ